MDASNPQLNLIGIKRDKKGIQNIRNQNEKTAIGWEKWGKQARADVYSTTHSNSRHQRACGINTM